MPKKKPSEKIEERVSKLREESHGNINSATAYIRAILEYLDEQEEK